MGTVQNTRLLALAIVALLGGQVAYGGLIERYDFEGATGLEDSSGNGNNATQSGLEFVSDAIRSGTVAKFSGSDHLGVPVGSGTANQWSVATWMRIKQNSYFIDTRANPGGDNLILSAGQISSGRLGYWDGSSWINSSNSPVLTDNRWHHVAWVFDGSADTMSYYFDGNKTNTVTATTDRDVGDNFWIGGAGAQFVGRIDDFHFYDSTLSDSDVAALAAGAGGTVASPTEFKIDIDSTTNGPLDTAPGWTSLDATQPSDGDEVVVGDVIFNVFSADGSRSRSGPNSLTRDFVFDDGSGQAVGLEIWHLPEGNYEAKVWAWEDAGGVGDLIVGWIKQGGSENIVTTTAVADPDDPIVTFRFYADGTSMYRIFTRENNSQNRARFNALQLNRIPEPSTFVLAAFGLLGLVFCGRRSRRLARPGLR